MRRDAEAVVIVGREIHGRLWPLILGLLCCGLLPCTAFACSLVDAQRSLAEAVFIARAWWLGSGLLAFTIVVVEVRRRRRSLLLLAAPLLVLFHPAWWGGPSYGPDCSFAIVEASHVVFAVLLVMLCYTFFLGWRARRRG